MFIQESVHHSVSFTQVVLQRQAQDSEALQLDNLTQASAVHFNEVDCCGTCDWRLPEPDSTKQHANQHCSRCHFFANVP